MISSVLSSVDDFIYSYILIFLLIFIGVYFTFRTRFVQIRLFKDAIKFLVDKEKPNDSDKNKTISSFEALMVSTASRIGTGNIVGIATAIAIGGAGSVFWMWTMAVIGSASAFIESTLAQVYKIKKRDDGKFRGGPSYYIQYALKSRRMGILFSVFLILSFAYGFNALHSYNISSSFEYYIPNFQNSIWPYVIGIVLSLLTAVVIFGGIHRIGFISSIIVPIMATVYLGFGIIAMLLNIKMLPSIFAQIFSNAFDFKSILGGFAGSSILIGIKKGLFSNEAGMGSAPNASASADVSHPAKQGLVQVISVGIDTLLICSTTAFLLLVSGIDPKTNGLNGIPYVQLAIKSTFGNFGILILTISIFTFAYSSIIGNYFYAENNVLFIRNNRKLLFVFRISCVIAVFLGSIASFETVWSLAEIFMGVTATINIVAIFLLRNRAIKVLKDYERQRQNNKNPVFKAKNVGFDDTQEWL